MTLTEVELKILELENKIKKIDEKEAKDKLTKGDIRDRGKYRQELQKFQMMKSQMTTPNDGQDDSQEDGQDDNTGGSNTGDGKTGDGKDGSKTGGNNTGGNKTGGSNNEKTLEEKYQELLKKQQELADQLNDANLMNQKLADEKALLEQIQNGLDQVDEATETNMPTWFWREAQEMAPTDKAKRGFIIANHVLNRLGTTTGNIGAIVQNAGGSGGASIKKHGDSLIDQYRQGKLEQAIANRKTKQDARIQTQLDAYTAVGAEEKRMREAQRRLRNSGFWGNFERLSGEQQVYLRGLLYYDTEGEITNAMIGNIIDQLMKGKDVSLEDVAVSTLTAGGIDNLDTIVKEAKSLGDKALNWMFGKKAGE